MVLPVTRLPRGPALRPVTAPWTLSLASRRAVALRPIGLRTSIPPVGASTVAVRTTVLPFTTGAGGSRTALVLRTTVLPLTTGAGGLRTALVLRTTVAPVRPPGRLRSAALPLGTALRPIALSAALLPPVTAVLGATTGGSPPLPGPLTATPGRTSSRSGAPALRTALPGAATAPSGSLSAGTAGASSR
jgi:hypothetical protein